MNEKVLKCLYDIKFAIDEIDSFIDINKFFNPNYVIEKNNAKATKRDKTIHFLSPKFHPDFIGTKETLGIYPYGSSVGLSRMCGIETWNLGFGAFKKELVIPYTLIPFT